MHRFFGNQDAYSLFIQVGYWAMILTNLLYFKSKQNATSLFSKNLIYASSKIHKVIGNIVRVLLFVIETYLASDIIDEASNFNRIFGNIFDTGANYYGLLTAAPIYVVLFSLVFVINPLKELDIMTMGLPVFLFFIKLSCFFNGCCWGIEWEYGMYNTHYDHPGKQVPVQLIEAIIVVVILLFLLKYRKKAKPGTIYPMYLATYSFTRFFYEFLSAAHTDVIGPFNMYHILSACGFVVGVILLIIMNKYGEQLSDYFEKPHIRFEEKVANYEERKALESASAKAQAEADEKERLEKIKIAREKASAKYKK